MRQKVEERNRARELRAQGWSLRRIARDLEVALSSVSVWVRDIECDAERGSRRRRSTRQGLGWQTIALRSIPAVEGAKALRVCSKCRRRKPAQQFGRHQRNGRQWWCKNCFRDYFQKRGQLHRDQVAAGIKRRRREGYELVGQNREQGCRDCGGDDPLILEFDHVGVKRANVSDMVRAAVAPARVRAEIRECEVVCANCHRIRTLRRLAKCWRTDPDFIETNQSYTPGQRRNMLYVRMFLEASRCIDCGLDDLRVLEFDHVFGKTACVTVMAREGSSLNRLQDEVSRCEVRCANCHRRRTILAWRAL